jgi:hypothetical protein
MSSLNLISTVFVTTASVSTTTTILYWAVPPSTFTTTYISATTSSPTGSDPGPAGAFGPRLEGGSIAGIVLAILFFIAVCTCIGLGWPLLRTRCGTKSAAKPGPSTTAISLEEISAAAESERAIEALSASEIQPGPSTTATSPEEISAAAEFECAIESLPAPETQPSSESSPPALDSNSKSEK